ncbi:hypothetical protein CALVIDRAFT_36549 [Calocera viscosa TUFC12733]|uniref:F-box domain-containing protein n=1 Tax=Calocera viscosa (strain TUFC12733) TaxID=1330018 RepID=A0A167NYC4_CALVF|nr:hypothetical protein CALVIDRAFT_36549 [Calocera viscosa TUFC12733]
MHHALEISEIVSEICSHLEPEHHLVLAQTCRTLFHLWIPLGWRSIQLPTMVRLMEMLGDSLNVMKLCPTEAQSQRFRLYAAAIRDVCLEDVELVPYPAWCGEDPSMAHKLACFFHNVRVIEIRAILNGLHPFGYALLGRGVITIQVLATSSHVGEYGGSCGRVSLLRQLQTLDLSATSLSMRAWSGFPCFASCEATEALCTLLRRTKSLTKLDLSHLGMGLNVLKSMEEFQERLLELSIVDGLPLSLPQACLDASLCLSSLQKLNLSIMDPAVTSQVLSRITAPKLHTLAVDTSDFTIGQAKSLLRLLHFCSVKTLSLRIHQTWDVDETDYPFGPFPAELNRMEQPVAELFQLFPPLCSQLVCLDLYVDPTCFFDLSDDIVKTISQACPLLEAVKLWWHGSGGVREWSGWAWPWGLFDATALTFHCLEYFKTNCPRLRTLHITKLQGWNGIHNPRTQCSMDRSSSCIVLHLEYTPCDFPDEIYTYLRSLWSYVDLKWTNIDESQQESRWSSVRERFEELS